MDIEDLRDHPQTRAYLKSINFFSLDLPIEKPNLKINTNIKKISDGLVSTPAVIDLKNIESLREDPRSHGDINTIRNEKLSPLLKTKRKKKTQSFANL